MSRPVVTLNDVLEADPLERFDINSELPTGLVGVSADVFIKRHSTISGYDIVAYRYKWQSGKIERLFKCNVDKSFTIIDNRLALQLTGDMLSLCRIEDAGIDVLDSIKVDQKHVQSHALKFTNFRQVTNSRSLIYIRSIDKWSLYYITPGSRLKHITSIDGGYYFAEIYNGALIVQSNSSWCQLATRTPSGHIVARDFSNELNGTFFATIEGIGKYDSLSRYLGVGCSHLYRGATFVELTTSPNVDKIGLVYQHSSHKVLVARNVSGELQCETIISQPVYKSNYCPHTGLHYFIEDGQLGFVNVESLSSCMTDKKMSQLCHLWLPRPTCPDLYPKYVPILEAHTNLPSDLCRLVSSYLDW